MRGKAAEKAIEKNGELKPKKKPGRQPMTAEEKAAAAGGNHIDRVRRG